MTALSYLMRLINLTNRIIGNTFMWLSVGIVLVCFWVVVERYVFLNTRLWMQDLYPWMNGVDIFYRPASTLRKAWLDLLGVCIFLMPFAWVVWSYCFTFVARSWRLGEASANPGGMPGLWVLKTFILVLAVVIALQGLAMAIRSILIIAGRYDLVPEDYRYKYDTETA